jgi:hypothetical protein
VHGLVEPEALHIGPFEGREERILPRHLGRALQRLESDELGAALRLDAAEDRGERDADPRDHHRPPFDAAHAVDALLERMRLDEVLESVGRGLADETVDLHRPG